MKKFLAILTLCLASWAGAAGFTAICHFPYTNYETQNQTLDKLDILFARTYANCNTAFPLFAGVTTTTTSSTSSTSSSSTSTSSTSSTSTST